MTYPFPPLVPADPEELAAAMSRTLGDAWDEVQAARQAVLTSANQLRRDAVLARLDELLASVARFQQITRQVAAEYARTHIPGQYAAGALTADPSFSWTQPHRAAAQSLAADSYADLLRRSQEAGRTSEAFARHVRRTVRARAAFAVTAGKTASQVGRELAEQLGARGISAVTYANGREVPVRAYTEMAVRTKTGVAHNIGTLAAMRDVGVEWVEVFDGAECGLTSHQDGDKPNGTIRRADVMAGHVLGHPNCRRALAPRPDVETAAQARSAAPLTTAAQREDQAQAERDRAATVPRRAAQTARERRQVARQQRLTAG